MEGFQAALWQKPETYLDPAVRREISTFAKLPSDAVNRGLAWLSDDLHSGPWEKHEGYLPQFIELNYQTTVRFC